MIHVIGHEIVKKRFQNSLPFNLVLVGPVGIGKKRLASWIALQHAISFDILALEPVKSDKDEKEKGVGIGQIRAVGKFVSTRPYGSNYKIIVIDAGGMTDAAAQALLRMLEEAHPRVRFILTTSGSLPLTILSRCVKVQVSPLSDVEVLEVLEMLGFTSDASKIAAKLAGGSVAAALDHLQNAERRRSVLSVLQLMITRRIAGVLPVVRTFTEAEVTEAINWFSDLLLAPFGRTSFYTMKELAIGVSLSPEDIDKYLKLLRTPLKPSLKFAYMAVKMLEDKR
jgi:DNA polymerase III delta prime subunit